MAEASADRRALIRDLELREKQFLEQFKQTYEHTQPEQLSELDLLIQEVKKKEKQDRVLSSAQKTEEFKLQVKFKRSVTREMVLVEFNDFFVVNCDPISDRKFNLTFKYRDTMMRALKQVTSCEMKLTS